MKSTFERLRELICTNLQVSPDVVSDATRVIDDLGAGSLELVELALSIEAEFGVVIPEPDYTKLLTFGAAVKYIDTRLAEGSA